ncbi:hypothetical protein CVT24_011087 [Panaeolus cyanescens]|uniref:Uncharacterized protein n=1 Tax=Panaeolus cyanescens TaxID=181874 RepID=A0A409YVG2_9AGAR|nr:hypothetical protein CVT24_011087 [Panaeolus cyanescens]
MAQPVFDEHPLEEYLRDAGETSTLMPGISAELEVEIDPHPEITEETSQDDELEWCPEWITRFLEILQQFISSAIHEHAPSPFVERFKYSIISSSLLATSLPTPLPGRSQRSFSIPGKLQHSRTPSLELDRLSPAISNSSDSSLGPISFSAASVVVLLGIGYPTLALLALLVTFAFVYNFIPTNETPKHDMTSSLNALDDLTSANETWESVVQDALTFLDNEERTPSGPSSSSPVRVALHSCLQTTQTHCDNIRQLFSALTSPSELSQLSEMYAPPSPMKSVFASDHQTRPFSFPSPRLASQFPTTPENKRSTWNGSYSSLAFSGSPTSPLYRRRDRHRTNISDLFQGNTNSAPVTPMPKSPNPQLPGVAELYDGMPSSSSEQFSLSSNHFGAAALELQRKRKTAAIEVLQMPTPPATASVFDYRSPRSPPMYSSTIASSSRFTSAQPAKHPLSFAALNYAVQGAVAAKRYACAHLLALRFNEEDDEGYWEDTRSVMGLLTTTLTDTCARLSEALEEAERANLREQVPTPGPERQMNEASSLLGSMMSEAASMNYARQPRSREGSASFAPMPSHLSRFAAHIAAIKSALDDAREDMDECMVALKSDNPSPSGSYSASGSTRRLRHSRSLTRMLSSSSLGLGASGLPNGAEGEREEPRALQAYERLRRELGMALRECERGRERLLEIINPKTSVSSDDEEEFEDLPGLGHDGSDESDRPGATSPMSDDEGDVRHNSNNAVAVEDTGDLAAMDDATAHLLLAASAQHLPLPGVEEVYEAETGPLVAFARERSKLSREERIKIAKARRESGQSVLGGIGVGGDEVKGGVMEKWGPGGEVVQELKDVIWKVGQRKRKMTTDLTQTVQSAVPSQSEEKVQLSTLPRLEEEPVQVLETL